MDSGLARADWFPVSFPRSFDFDGAAHDLSGPGLGDVLDEVDLVWKSIGLSRPVSAQ